MEQLGFFSSRRLSADSEEGGVKNEGIPTADERSRNLLGESLVSKREGREFSVASQMSLACSADAFRKASASRCDSRSPSLLLLGRYFPPVCIGAFNYVCTIKPRQDTISRPTRAHGPFDGGGGGVGVRAHTMGVARNNRAFFPCGRKQKNHLQGRRSVWRVARAPRT